MQTPSEVHFDFLISPTIVYAVPTDKACGKAIDQKQLDTFGSNL